MWQQFINVCERNTQSIFDENYWSSIVTAFMSTFVCTKQYERRKTSQKNSNIQPSLHIHQTSGTSNQQLDTAALIQFLTYYHFFIVYHLCNFLEYSHINGFFYITVFRVWETEHVLLLGLFANKKVRLINQ